MTDRGREERQQDEAMGAIVDSVTQHIGQPGEGDQPAGNEAMAEEFLRQQVPAESMSATPTRAPQPAEAATVPPTTESGMAAAPAPDPDAERLQREVDDLKRKIAERNTENLALKAVNQQMEQFAQIMRPPERPQEPARIPIAFDEHNQPYVDPSIAQHMIDERVNQLVQEKVQESLRPLTAASETYGRMRRDFPEFSSEEDRFGQWLAANPQYRERVTTNPSEGLETAYLRYRYESGQARDTQATQAANAGQAVISGAQRHAAPAGGTSGAPSRRVTETEARTRKLRELAKYAEDTGDWKPYYKMRLEEGLGQSFLDTMDKTTWGR